MGVGRRHGGGDIGFRLRDGVLDQRERTGRWQMGWGLEAERNRADHGQVGGEAGPGPREQQTGHPGAYTPHCPVPMAVRWLDEMTLHAIEIIGRIGRWLTVLSCAGRRMNFCGQSVDRLGENSSNGMEAITLAPPTQRLSRGLIESRVKACAPLPSLSRVNSSLRG